MTERLDFSVTTGERFSGGFFDTDCNSWSPIGLAVASIYAALGRCYKTAWNLVGWDWECAELMQK